MDNLSIGTTWRSVGALAGATQSECLRDRATLLAVGLLGLGTLSLHATTVFAIGGEQGMRAELARNSMLLAVLATVAFALLRHGGVEWSRVAIAPLVCSPLGRSGWFVGRVGGVLGAAGSIAGAIAVATVAMEGFAGGVTTASLAAWSALILLGAGAMLRVSRPTSMVGRSSGGAGVAFAALALLSHALVSPDGVALLAALCGATGVAGVLAAVGFTVSMWLPAGGALGVVVATYLLGHVAVHSLWPGVAAGWVWRIAIPDLAGMAALEPFAASMGVVWAGGVAWIGCERARIRES